MIEQETTKFHISTSRLKYWNYANNGYYFITICTFNKKNLFGKIVEGKILLNEYGNVVEEEWLKSFILRAELFCDTFITMPNHLHGIVCIENSVQIKTQELIKLNNNIPVRQPKSISSFVAGFKAAVTTRLKKYYQLTDIKIWQPGYYDRIIRDEAELLKTREYIANNPLQWELDKYFSQI